ncbi:tyrosine-type recombinase/integrase, partial [Acinetobacter baumannii]
VSELCSLRVGDIDPQPGTLRVRGKGGKTRLIPIGEVALDGVRAYLETARPLAASERETVLFVSPRGGALTRQGFWKLIKR